MQMYNAVSPREIKDLILRRLGAPIVQVEVSEDQIYDSISRALELYIEYHPDGMNKVYCSIVVSEEQAASGIFNLDIPATAISKVLNTTGTSWSIGGVVPNGVTNFIQSLMGGAAGSCSSYYQGSPGGGLSSYYSFMMYQNLMKDLLAPAYDYWYNGVNKQLSINANLQPGELIIVEAWVPSAMLVQESATGIIGNRANTLGSGANVTPEEEWADPYSTLRAQNYIGNPETHAQQNAYNVRWVKDMSTALVKQMNGTILKKNQGMMLPGGITVDGQTMYQEATEEIERLRQELMDLTVPLGVMIG